MGGNRVHTPTNGLTACRRHPPGSMASRTTGAGWKRTGTRYRNAHRQRNAHFTAKAFVLCGAAFLKRVLDRRDETWTARRESNRPSPRTTIYCCMWGGASAAANARASPLETETAYTHARNRSACGYGCQRKGQLPFERVNAVKGQRTVGERQCKAVMKGQQKAVKGVNESGCW